MQRWAGEGTSTVEVIESAAASRFCLEFFMFFFFFKFYFNYYFFFFPPVLISSSMLKKNRSTGMQKDQLLMASYPHPLKSGQRS